MVNYGVDQELLAGFIAESRDSLDPVDSLLIDLERHPDDPDKINNIFRPFHSIKGSAAFFGLLKVKRLAHLLEDLLDLIRQNKHGVTGEITSVILAGLDMLRTIFDNVTSGKTETEGIDEEYERLITHITEASRTDAQAAEALLSVIHSRLETVKQRMTGKAAGQVNEILNMITAHQSGSAAPDSASVEKHQAPIGDDPVATIRNILSKEIEGELDETSCSIIRTALEKIQAATANIPDANKIVDQTLENYHAFMENIGFDALLRDLILQGMDQLQAAWQWKGDEAGSEEQTEETTADAVGRKGDSRRTMRVYENSIDGFLEYVGELVVVEEMFKHVQKQMDAEVRNSGITSDFRRIMKTFSALSANLRNSILEIRSVPVSGLLRKANRIAHDIARESDKSIDVKITGDELLIDKSYLELLDAPFVHMVRNAADHGVEGKQERIRSGKPETGTIRIAARETEKEIEITIADDGRGIDHEALFQKALERGMIASNRGIDQTPIEDLIFTPGVSTAETVTDVSGRGVGMDVVKQNIESAGGRVMITSTPGHGSTFAALLPKNVSTQIIEGFLIQAGADVYVLPMELVNESFALQAVDVSSISGKGRVIARRESLMPLVNLNAALKGGGNGAQYALDRDTDGTIISINANGKLVALLVDRIIGVQKMILKEVDGLAMQHNLFQGAGIMGDGTVAMIIGAEGLSALVV